VELQQQKDEFANAGIEVFAISYDRQDAQTAFAEQHDIDYHMLADEDSAVIKQYGILNTLIAEDEGVYGIPFPGSYLVDEAGLVEEKFFHREYQIRETGSTVLRSGFGAAFDLSDVPCVEVEGDAKITATLGGASLASMQRGDLYVRIELDEGLHVNGPKVPDGFFATEVTVTAPEGVRVGETMYPQTTPFKIEGIDEQFDVFEGGVEVSVSLISTLREGETLPLEIAVQYQACNDRECFLPQQQTLHLDVPIGRLNMPRAYLGRAERRK
jgi:hypothetical protein